MKHSLNPQHNTTAGSHPVKSSIRWHNIRTSSYWNIFKLSACFFLIIILLYFTHIGCPIKFITGISCPACGMTRAVLAILHGDTHAALNYHPLVLTLPVLLISVIVYIVNTRRIIYRRVCTTNVKYHRYYSHISTFTINIGQIIQKYLQIIVKRLSILLISNHICQNITRILVGTNISC